MPLGEAVGVPPHPGTEQGRRPGDGRCWGRRGWAWGDLCPISSITALRGTPEAETSGSSEDEAERPPGQLHGQPGGCGWPPGWTGRTLPEREAAPVQEKVHGQLVSRPGPGGADFQEGPGLQTLRAAGCCPVREHVGQLLVPAASPQSAGPSGHCPLPSALSRLLSEPQPRPLPKQLCTQGASGPAGLRSPFRGLLGAALSLSEPCLLHLHGGGVGDSAPSGGSHHG